jgi:hypothetical protein
VRADLSLVAGECGRGVDRLACRLADTGHSREELLGIGVLGVVEHAGDRATFDDAPVAHHDDVIGEVGDDAHVVRDEQDRRVEAVPQVPHEVEDLGLTVTSSAVVGSSAMRSLGSHDTDCAIMARWR